MPHAPLYAAIDLGSNSFHMLVVQEVAGALRTVAKVKRRVCLAAGLNSAQQLDRAAMVRGWDCLRLFAEHLQDIPTEQVRIVGTATLRLARNVDEFLLVAERLLGHPIEIISGEEEAKTIYAGVSWTSAGAGQRLVIDIGGASTEIVIGQQRETLLLTSLSMGCVTWLDRYFAQGSLSAANFSHAIAAARTTLANVVAEYRALGWQSCVGASGVVQALQEILRAQGQSEHITLSCLLGLRAQAIACGNVAQLQMVGLTPARQAVFPSGLAILIALFEALGIEHMTLAGGALREGLIYGLLGKAQGGDARERTATSLLARYQLDEEQALRVRDTALSAFAQVETHWQLSAVHARPLLRYAALLHEIGLCIEYKQAPKHAAYIIEHIDMPGFTRAQKQLLSALLLNQRDNFTASVLASQGAVDTQQAQRLARILRLALILCLRRAHGSVPAFTLTAQGDVLQLTLPRGWLEAHYLRASELRQEMARQLACGWPLQLLEAELD
ncbi:MAG: guanosine-5'-triphosphate,3'-diphosphate diphosphatase [Aeromonas sp.]